MSNPSSEPVSLHLIDREFLLACSPDEREGLIEAAGFLDRKMRELKSNAKAPSFERLAVLAALSVTHDFLTLRKRHEGHAQRLSDGLALLQNKLDSALPDASAKN